MKNLSPDSRIPIVFGATPGADDAVLTEGDLPAQNPSHPIGCACCAPRGAVADTLARLFLDRARNRIPYFHRVVVTGSASFSDAVREAASTDLVARSRYRLEPEPATR